MAAALPLLVITAPAAAPTFDHLYPVAVQRGTTNLLAAVGKFDPWPPRIWVDAPGILFKPETNNGRFMVEVAADAPSGPHLVRLFNEAGASEPRFLVLTDRPQLPEQEPNDEFAKPQLVENLPASFNARLDKSGDVDSYGLRLEAGQTVVAALDAYMLGSPVDAVLRLVDNRGVEVAFNHDNGRTLDPELIFTAEKAGSYVVQVFGFAYPATADVRFTGNNKCVYRLHLSRGPWLRHTLPLGVQRGGTCSLRLVGCNLGRQVPSEVQFDGARLDPACRMAPLHLPGIENELALLVGDGPERMECEPNDATNETSRFEVPFAITGCIARSDDRDRFAFAAKKGEKFLLEVQSAALGFSLDAWLKVEDTTGKELAQKDDNAGADPVLEWTAPGDGVFVAAVGSVLRRGGSSCFYRLNVQRPVPSLRAIAASHHFAIQAGKTNDLKVNIKRLHGFDSKLTLAVDGDGLPPGLHVDPMEVPSQGGDVILKLVAASDAKPFTGPIEIHVQDTGSGKEYPVVAELISSEVNNGVPGGFAKLLINSIARIWLTVLPLPAPKE